MPPQKTSRGFSFFGVGGGLFKNSDPALPPPSLKLQTDKNVYRPADPLTITIQIRNPTRASSLLIERLSFEIKGIEKLDTQWFNTQKPLPDPKQRRGEYVFMDCSAPSVVSNQILSSGSSKTYVIRTILPSIIPPSYRGAAIRYLYYVKSTLSGQYIILENGQQSHSGSIQKFAEMEARTPLNIWVSQKTNGLVVEDAQADGIVPPATVQLDVYWKEIDGDSDWARVNETYDGNEEGGYESSRDEVSSVSSYNPSKESLHKTFGSSLSLQSFAGRSSNVDAISPYLEERASMSSYVPPPRLSVAEVLYDSGGDVTSQQKSPAVLSPSQQLKHAKSFAADDESKAQLPVTSEDFVRGRSYNIRLDDQVLLRFSPKNSDSNYYFSDMIGGTLTFFREEQARRCLELSITLEMSETISGRSVHHSRRHSPTITKVHSDHHEVVADLVQTSFLFSIPTDGPMSFSTRHVSVQWSLRFEFYTTPKNLDWTRYEHPLMIEGRDKCDWVLPITVHAPPQGNSARNDKSLSLDPLWATRT